MRLGIAFPTRLHGLKSTCASAQSDQNIHMALCGLPRIQCAFTRTAKTLINLHGSVSSSLDAHSLAGNVMSSFMLALVINFYASCGYCYVV